jgi:hypothetical protein
LAECQGFAVDSQHDKEQLFFTLFFKTFFVDVFGCNRLNIAINMSNSAGLKQNFKVGVLKELHKR